MPSFRPSCVIRLTLIFDEVVFQTIDAIPPGQTIDDNVAAPSVEQQLGAKPLLLQKGHTASFIHDMVPKKANFELPGYRQAGQFTAVLDYKDLPLTPRAVRSASVEAHLGAVQDDDFVAGLSQPNPGGPRRSIVLAKDALGNPNRDTLVGVFLVDDWDEDHDDNGSTITLKGRDLRGVLLDTEIATHPSVTGKFWDQLNLTKPVDELVRDILALDGRFAMMPVVTNAEDWPDGFVPAASLQGALPRHRQGAKPGKKRKTNPRATLKTETGKLNFWDLIVQFCYMVGGIPFFVGNELHIRPVKSIFDQYNAGIDPIRDPTPFKDGQRRGVDAISKTGINPPLTLRKMVYGRDTKKYSFDRKYAGYQRPKVVRVISSDPTGDSDLPVVVEWPPNQHLDSKVAIARKTRVSPGGDQTQTEVLNIPAPLNVTDPVQMLEIARSVYEEIGRGEMGGSVETPNLSSFGGDNTDPDLLHLRPGDGIELRVDTRTLSKNSPLIATLTDTERDSVEDQIQRLRAKGLSSDFAKAVIFSTRAASLELRFFRVSTVKFDWSWQGGIKIEFDFQNYVVSRADTQFEEQARAAAKAARPKTIETQLATRAAQASGLAMDKGLLSPDVAGYSRNISPIYSPVAAKTTSPLVLGSDIDIFKKIPGTNIPQPSGVKPVSLVGLQVYQVPANSSPNIQVVPNSPPRSVGDIDIFKGGGL